MDSEERARLRDETQSMRTAMEQCHVHGIALPSSFAWRLMVRATNLLDALDAAEARIAALTEESFQRTLAIDLGPECGGEWGVNTLCELMATLGHPKDLEEAARVIEHRVST